LFSALFITNAKFFPEALGMTNVPHILDIPERQASAAARLVVRSTPWATCYLTSNGSQKQAPEWSSAQKSRSRSFLPRGMFGMILL